MKKKFRNNFVFILFPELFRFPVLVLNARKAEIVPENVENHIPELFRFLSLFRSYIVRNYIGHPCFETKAKKKKTQDKKHAVRGDPE